MDAAPQPHDLTIDAQTTEGGTLGTVDGGVPAQEPPLLGSDDPSHQSRRASRPFNLAPFDQVSLQTLTATNPAPTPPPNSPLPALPPLTSSPLFDMDFGLLNLAGRQSSSVRSSRILPPKRPSAANIFQDSTTDVSAFEGSRPSLALEDRTVSDAFLLDVLSAASAHQTFERWHNPQPSLGGDAPPRISLSTSDTPRVKRLSPSASHVHTPAQASPRNSIALDIVSLSETSKSLLNLSKRLSVSERRRSSLDAFDPFEYDRFDDTRQPSSSRASPNANEMAISLTATPATGDDGSPSSTLSLASVTPVASHGTLDPATLRTPSRPRPARLATAAVSQDLLQRSLHLADKRADLEARRALLLGSPLPPKPTPALAHTPTRAEFPPPLDTKRDTMGHRPPTLLLVGRPRRHDRDDSRSSTASGTDSLKSISSTSTARPRIVLRPGTASGGASPLSQNFDAPSSPSPMFSPSSMTFGGDCHAPRPSSPPPLPSKHLSGIPPPVPSKHDSVPPPPPPKDPFVVSPEATSPDMQTFMSSASASLSRDRSMSLEDMGASGSRTRRISASRVRRVPPEVATRRLSHASSMNSLHGTGRNYSYPFDAYVDVEEGTEPEEESDDFRASYYYSHAEGAISPTGKVGSNASRLVDGWIQPEPGISGSRPFSTAEALLEEDDDSDSSLDLHTPLPDILVKAGVLSSKSALMASGGESKEPAGKSKEQRAADLAKGAGNKVISRNRLVRHRDGKNLGLGLGLTTGLGWSDSEDEDAPSPLRRHISRVILSKKSSLASFSTLASSASISNFSSRRESILSSTTASSGNSLYSGKGSATTHSTIQGSSVQLARLRTTNLRGSQSLAQISTLPTRPHLQSRQTSASVSLPYGHVANPPSSFTSHRSSKLSSASQPSSISSLGSILMAIPQPMSRSPASSSTSLSTNSSLSSPLTPCGNDGSPRDSAIVAAAPSPLGSGKIGLGIVSEEDSMDTPRRTPQPSKPDNKGFGYMQTSVSSIKGSRSRSGSQVGAPPSSFGKTPTLSGTPAMSPAGNRNRTMSNGSTASNQGSAIPGPRARTASNSSVATSGSTGVKNKSSLPSLKNGSGSTGHSPSPSIASSLMPPPPLPSMTVGSLAFPSPPPLSPAIVSMRLAQAQAQAELKRGSASSTSFPSSGLASIKAGAI